MILAFGRYLATNLALFPVSENAMINFALISMDVSTADAAMASRVGIGLRVSRRIAR